MNKMCSFKTQMVKLHNEDEDYSNIYPNEGWVLNDYKELFTYIGKGYLVQCHDNNAFMINEEWEGDPMWEEENLKQYEIKCGWCEEQDLDVCCPINCVKNRQDGVELTVCGECWEEMDKKIWYEPDEDEDNCLKCGELRGNHDISARNYLIPCESDGEEDEDKNLPELSCCRCFKEIKRDSEEHDETHINENQELICPDCMNGCDCESCLNEKDEDSISFHIPDINKIIMEGAFCRLCDNTLPPHTVARHLDKSDIIHTCPHSASQLLATEIRKEGK